MIPAVSYRFTRWQRRDDPSKVVAVEVYDHLDDPDENVNLAADPDHYAKGDG